MELSLYFLNFHIIGGVDDFTAFKNSTFTKKVTSFFEENDKITVTAEVEGKDVDVPLKIIDTNNILALHIMCEIDDQNLPDPTVYIVKDEQSPTGLSISLPIHQ